MRMISVWLSVTSLALAASSVYNYRASWLAQSEILAASASRTDLSGQESPTNRADSIDALNVRDFGALGDGMADDSFAIASAVDRANVISTSGRQVCIYIPIGKYRLARYQIPQFKMNGCIKGEGSIYSLIQVDRTYHGDIFSWSESWGGGVKRPGPRVEALGIEGELDTPNIQNAFMFYDRNDLVYMRDVSVDHLHGRCFSTGLSRAVSAAYMRESAFFDTRFWSCGTNELPAVEIGSNGSATDDSTNEIDWFGLSILDPAGRGLVIRNQGDRGMRDIRIHSLRVEGPTGSSSNGDLITIGDPSYVGKVFNVYIYGLQTNATPSGYSTVTIIAPSASSAPDGIFMSGCIGNGPGKGLNIRAGHNLRFDFGGMGVSGTQVTIGATPKVGQDIVLNGMGVERYWSYDVDPTVISAGFLRTLGVFKEGIPSLPSAGALVARPHDGTDVGGLPAGTAAVDLQLDTTGQSGRVAAGDYSVLVGGQGNRAGANYSVQVGGQANLNTSYFGVSGGGQGNKVSGYANVNVGGAFNELSGQFSSATSAFYGSDRGRYGCQDIVASGRLRITGDAQSCVTVLRGVSRGGTPVRLTSDGQDASSRNIINIPPLTTYGLTIKLLARNVTTPSKSFTWAVSSALLNCETTHVSCKLSSLEPVVLATDSWRPTVSVAADKINGGLELVFRPPPDSSDLVDVVARVETVEAQ